jgi:hypothetical protein
MRGLASHQLFGRSASDLRRLGTYRLDGGQFEIVPANHRTAAEGYLCRDDLEKDQRLEQLWVYFRFYMQNVGLIVVACGSRKNVMAAKMILWCQIMPECLASSG